MGRNETNFRDVTSKSGDFSPHIGKHTAERLWMPLPKPYKD